MNTQDQKLSTDYLETMSASNPSTPSTPDDSPSSAFDAGVDDESLGQSDLASELDQPLPGEIPEDDAAEYSRREIPMADLPDAPRADPIQSSELSDLNTPGEIDIEGLDEEAVSDSLPPDARLDPLEE